VDRHHFDDRSRCSFALYVTPTEAAKLSEHARRERDDQAIVRFTYSDGREASHYSLTDEQAEGLRLELVRRFSAPTPELIAETAAHLRARAEPE
jgi:hypothetical protein